LADDAQTINEWLAAAERQVREFGPIAAEQRAVRIQTEQLKVRHARSELSISLVSLYDSYLPGTNFDL